MENDQRLHLIGKLAYHILHWYHPRSDTGKALNGIYMLAMFTDAMLDSNAEALGEALNFLEEVEDGRQG